MQQFWNWIARLRVVEYRLCQEDRERIDALQFHMATILDEFQALTLETSASREAIESLAEELKNIHGELQKGKGRTPRRASRPPHQKPSPGSL